MKKKKPETNISISPTKSYEEYLKRLDLVVLALENTACKLDRTLYMKLRRHPERGVRSITAKSEIIAFEDDHFDISTEFLVTVTDKETAKVGLSAQCTFRSHYHGKRPLSRDFSDRFAHAEYRFVVWPYFRQFIFDITARMYLTPVTVPLQPDLIDQQ